MAREHRFLCLLPNGVHARPASALEEVARRFASSISILNERSGHIADGRSVLAIVGADIRFGDWCSATVVGPDEVEAHAALAQFLDHDLARCDSALPQLPEVPGAIRLPPLLRAARAEVRAGTPASPGIGRGIAVRIGGVAIPDSLVRRHTGDTEAELALLHVSLDAVLRHYDSRLAPLGGGVEADVLKAHRSVTQDPEFMRRLEAAIREDGLTVAGAIESAGTYFTSMLFNTGSLLLRERALDVRDVCIELLRQAYGDAARPREVQLESASICMADTLTPGQLLGLDRRLVSGLVLAHVGTTSHTVILAKSFGIPTLVGVLSAGNEEDDGREMIVDADLGVLVTSPSDAVRRYYDMEERRLATRRIHLRQYAQRDAVTADGLRIRISANISSVEETRSAIEAGAEGIGVFRTEMLFVDRDEAPSEAEQFEHYRRAVEDAGGRPVIIRSLDIGGDKPIPYLRLQEEDNPFLGYRAVRLYPEFESLFRDQIRALVRASAFGRLQLMVPMVTTLEEVRWVKAVVASEQQRAAEAGVAFDAAMDVGAMIEVPSAVFLLDHLCQELDFFSIGTNDLLQYFAAADRANPRTGGLYNPTAPAFVRLLKKVVDDLHARGARVGLCGEMAGEIRCLPLLVGLGLDELSLSPPGIAEVKAELTHLSATACQALVLDVLSCSTSAEVDVRLERFSRERPTALIEPDLIVVDAECRGKEEAIKLIADRLYVTGRTDRPRDVEEAVWQREAVYSSGFGHGFAVPHCRTDAVRMNSLAVLKLKTPVSWGALDGEPVGTVILLVMPEADQLTAATTVLAALARKLARAEFRQRLSHESDARTLCESLTAALGAPHAAEEQR